MSKALRASIWLTAALLGLGFVQPSAAQALKPWKGGATPALALADLDGKVHRLEQYHGQVVLVNFWATWCGPCRAEMPSIERLRQSMQGKPFSVLAVNVGESGRVAGDFIERLQVRFTVLLDRDRSTTRAWGARVLPASFIVGRDGRVRYTYLGELDWASDEVRERIEALMASGTRRASAESRIGS